MANKTQELSEIEKQRHSLSHILAYAVLQMFPDAKFGMGPAIENGFYYDFDLPRSLTPEDLKTIEKKMKEIVKKDLPFEKFELPANKALEVEKDQPYKKELIEDLKKQGEKEVSFYKIGDFEDLCAGPHTESTGKVGEYNLMSVAGAYWKGSEENKMLQRVYGVAFPAKEELENYLIKLEEAKKRDHRKLGRELDLFYFSDLVGPGLPLFTPKGTVILDQLQKHIEKLSGMYGFQKVSTPHLAKIELFEKSGHKQKFGDELFHVTSHYKQNYVLKPVQCPHQIQIYASRPRSYRDLPIRYMESNKQYRDEKPGEINGLKRVIAITVEDGHTFCTKKQVKEEIISMVRLIQDFYNSLGLLNEFKVTLSVRDYSAPEKYIGDKKDWDECEKILEEVAIELKLDAEKCEGEAALYGPKLDFMFKDVLGNEVQIPTVQIDFATPKRFELSFTNENGEDETPVMVHRAVLGSYERFMMLLLEHFAGALPTWLSPVQIKILPIADRHIEHAQKIASVFETKEIRVETDDRAESIGKKIREAEMQKIPYMLIVGDKEIEEEKVAVRRYGKGDLGSKSVDEFTKEIITEIKECQR